MDPNLAEANQQLSNALQHLQKDLSTIRAGRANPSLLEEIPVTAYGGRMKMVEVGTIAAPQPSLLTVTVWDASIVKDVEKAIMEANLGLTTSAEGQTIRVPIPPLNEERRQEFIKVAHQKGEECKVEIRRVRAETREFWEEEEKEGEIGEDELKRREKLLQDLIDNATASVVDYVKTKEQELTQL